MDDMSFGDSLRDSLNRSIKRSSNNALVNIMEEAFAELDIDSESCLDYNTRTMYLMTEFPEFCEFPRTWTPAPDLPSTSDSNVYVNSQNENSFQKASPLPSPQATNSVQDIDNSGTLTDEPSSSRSLTPTTERILLAEQELFSLRDTVRQSNERLYSEESLENSVVLSGHSYSTEDSPTVGNHQEEVWHITKGLYSDVHQVTSDTDERNCTNCQKVSNLPFPHPYQNASVGFPSAHPDISLPNHDNNTYSSYAEGDDAWNQNNMTYDPLNAGSIPHGFSVFANFHGMSSAGRTSGIRRDSTPNNINIINEKTLREPTNRPHDSIVYSPGTPESPEVLFTPATYSRSPNTPDTPFTPVNKYKTNIALQQQNGLLSPTSETVYRNTQLNSINREEEYILPSPMSDTGEYLSNADYYPPEQTFEKSDYQSQDPKLRIKKYYLVPTTDKQKPRFQKHVRICSLNTCREEELPASEFQYEEQQKTFPKTHIGQDFKEQRVSQISSDIPEKRREIGEVEQQILDDSSEDYETTQKQYTVQVGVDVNDEPKDPHTRSESSKEESYQNMSYHDEESSKHNLVELLEKGVEMKDQKLTSGKFNNYQHYEEDHEFKTQSNQHSEDVQRNSLLKPKMLPLNYILGLGNDDPNDDHQVLNQSEKAFDSKVHGYGIKMNAQQYLAYIMRSKSLSASGQTTLSSPVAMLAVTSNNTINSYIPDQPDTKRKSLRFAWPVEQTNSSDKANPNLALGSQAHGAMKFSPELFDTFSTAPEYFKHHKKQNSRESKGSKGSIGFEEPVPESSELPENEVLSPKENSTPPSPTSRGTEKSKRSSEQSSLKTSEPSHETNNEKDAVPLMKDDYRKNSGTSHSSRKFSFMGDEPTLDPNSRSSSQKRMIEADLVKSSFRQAPKFQPPPMLHPSIYDATREYNVDEKLARQRNELRESQKEVLRHLNTSDLIEIYCPFKDIFSMEANMYESSQKPNTTGEPLKHPQIFRLNGRARASDISIDSEDARIVSSENRKPGVGMFTKVQVRNIKKSVDESIETSETALSKSSKSKPEKKNIGTPEEAATKKTSNQATRDRIEIRNKQNKMMKQYQLNHLRNFMKLRINEVCQRAAEVDIEGKVRKASVNSNILSPLAITRNNTKSGKEPIVSPTGTVYVERRNSCQSQTSYEKKINGRTQGLADREAVQQSQKSVEIKDSEPSQNSNEMSLDQQPESKAQTTSHSKTSLRSPIDSGPEGSSLHAAKSNSSQHALDKLIDFYHGEDSKTASPEISNSGKKPNASQLDESALDINQLKGGSQVILGNLKNSGLADKSWKKRLLVSFQLQNSASLKAKGIRKSWGFNKLGLLKRKKQPLMCTSSQYNINSSFKVLNKGRSSSVLSFEKNDEHEMTAKHPSERILFVTNADILPDVHSDLVIRDANGCIRNVLYDLDDKTRPADSQTKEQDEQKDLETETKGGQQDPEVNKEMATKPPQVESKDVAKSSEAENKMISMSSETDKKDVTKPSESKSKSKSEADDKSSDPESKSKVDKNSSDPKSKSKADEKYSESNPKSKADENPAARASPQKKYSKASLEPLPDINSILSPRSGKAAPKSFDNDADVPPLNLSSISSKRPKSFLSPSGLKNSFQLKVFKRQSAGNDRFLKTKSADVGSFMKRKTESIGKGNTMGNGLSSTASHITSFRTSLLP